MKLLPTACEYFVSVCLVTYIPHKLVIRGIENIMQGNGKLHNTKAGAEMASMNADTVYNKLAQLVTYLLQLVFAQLFEVIGGIYLAKQRPCGYFFHAQY